MQRPFRILGLQQIAIGAPDRRPLEHLWVTLFGLPIVGAFHSERENVDEVIAQLGEGKAAVEVDLMQPINLHAKPHTHAPALHHVGLWVDNLTAAVTWLEAQGVRFAPGGIRKGAGGHDVCFIHPAAHADFPICGQGVLIELIQAPPER